MWWLGSFLKIAQSINSFFHIANWRHRSDCSHMRTQKSERSSGTGMEKNEQQQQKIFYSFDSFFFSFIYFTMCKAHIVVVVVFVESSEDGRLLRTQPASIWIITQNMWMNNWMWTSLSSHYSARRNVMMMMMSLANVRRTKAMQLTATQIYSSNRPINIFNRFDRSLL